MAGQTERFEVVTLRQGRERLDQHPWFKWAHIIHLHWTSGFLAPRQAWDRKTWVLSLHDAHPFTAVCHFPDQCRGFESGCATCPQLEHSRDPQRSARVFRQKQRGYHGLSRGTLHAPSQWIAAEASRSLLLGHLPSVVLPNLFPSGEFRALDRAFSRHLLKIPAGLKVALFVAGHLTNTRKGYAWFLRLADTLKSKDWLLVAVGTGGSEDPAIPVQQLGPLADLRLMAAAYSAADVFVSPTLQDNLPGTVIEAQLCGTPVIGFATGGQPEMIEQGVTGWLGPEISVATLQSGLAWYEQTRPSRQSIAERAHARWGESVLLPRWQNFYRSLT